MARQPDMKSELFFAKYREICFGKTEESKTDKNGNLLDRIKGQREKIKEEKPELYENVVQLLENSKKAKEEKEAAVRKAKNAFKKNANAKPKAKKSKPQNGRNQSSLSGGSTASQDSSQSEGSIRSSPSTSQLVEPFVYYKRDEKRRSSSLSQLAK